jgi:hypothetical protein
VIDVGEKAMVGGPETAGEPVTVTDPVPVTAPRATWTLTVFAPTGRPVQLTESGDEEPEAVVSLLPFRSQSTLRVAVPLAAVPVPMKVAAMVDVTGAVPVDGVAVTLVTVRELAVVAVMVAVPELVRLPFTAPAVRV